jgi:plastocyanin
MSARHAGSRRMLGAAALIMTSACGAAAATGTEGSGGAAAAPSAVSIPAADRFAPFVTTVQHGNRVTFHNGDSDLHTVVSVPGDSLGLALRLEPGQSITVTLSDTGAHRYYCSIHAHVDPATGQVAANPNADHPQEPMEGVLVVT